MGLLVPPIDLCLFVLVNSSRHFAPEESIARYSEYHEIVNKSAGPKLVTISRNDCTFIAPLSCIPDDQEACLNYVCLETRSSLSV